MHHAGEKIESFRWRKLLTVFVGAGRAYDPDTEHPAHNNNKQVNGATKNM